MMSIQRKAALAGFLLLWGAMVAFGIRKGWQERQPASTPTSFKQKLLGYTVESAGLKVPADWQKPWYFSNDPSIATVDENGKLHATFPGRTSVCAQKSASEPQLVVCADVTVE